MQGDTPAAAAIAITARVKGIPCDRGKYEIVTTIEDLNDVAKSLEAKFGEPRSAKLVWRPQNTVRVDDEAGEKILKLIGALEDNDDVQTVYANFEVSDALVGYSRSREFRSTQELLVASAQDARRLADLRYEGGTTSYLEVLDSESRLFAAELGLVQAQLNELAAFVDIYRALGGGWQS